MSLVLYFLSLWFAVQFLFRNHPSILHDVSRVGIANGAAGL